MLKVVQLHADADKDADRKSQPSALVEFAMTRAERVQETPCEEHPPAPKRSRAFR